VDRILPPDHLTHLSESPGHTMADPLSVTADIIVVAVFPLIDQWGVEYDLAPKWIPIGQLYNIRSSGLKKLKL
jgi:hypothetical protein